MARKPRVPRRIPRRNGRRNHRRAIARRSAHVSTNGPVLLRMPSDPPQRSTAYERSFVIRVLIVYDHDRASGDAWSWPNNNDGPISFSFARNEKATQLELPISVARLFNFHEERYGFNSGIALALRSVKVWGPLPPTDIRLSVTFLAREGRAPQTSEDIGTGMTRPKVGISQPILEWHPASTDDNLCYISFYTGEATPAVLKNDLTLATADISVVARNYRA